MRDEQTVQSECNQKGPQDVVKLLIGVGQMVWFGYKGELLMRNVESARNLLQIGSSNVLIWSLGTVLGTRSLAVSW